jgi:hypothetical protein
MFGAPDFLLQVIWEGLVSGVLYALIALGFVLIYKSSRIFNFAQGIMVVFAALTLVGFHQMGVPAYLAVALTLGVMFVLADRHRAGGASTAGEPARHHPVHGDHRHHAVPDRLRRDDLRRREQAMITEELSAYRRAAYIFEPFGGFVSIEQRDITAGGRCGAAGGGAPFLPQQDADRPRDPRARRRSPGSAVGRHLAVDDLGRGLVHRRHHRAGDRHRLGRAGWRFLRARDHRFEGAAGADAGRAGIASPAPSSAGSPSAFCEKLVRDLLGPAADRRRHRDLVRLRAGADLILLFRPQGLFGDKIIERI